MGPLTRQPQAVTEQRPRETERNVGSTGVARTEARRLVIIGPGCRSPAAVAGPLPVASRGVTCDPSSRLFTSEATTFLDRSVVCSAVSDSHHAEDERPAYQLCDMLASRRAFMPGKSFV